jgi:hypothetical protein
MVKKGFGFNLFFWAIFSDSEWQCSHQKTILGLKLKSLIRLVGWLLFKVSKKNHGSSLLTLPS